MRAEESCFHRMVLGQFIRHKCTHSGFTHDGFHQRHLILGDIVNTLNCITSSPLESFSPSDFGVCLETVDFFEM